MTFSIGEEFIISRRERMLKYNQNLLIAICGETGTGKSYTALAIADLISPRGITIKNNVVFSAEQFLRLLDNYGNLKRGDIIIFDEAGVGMASREWYSLQNKLLGSILQTFRNMNVGVIFTTPNLSFLDSQARKLFHNYLETIEINHEREVCILKVYNIQHNSRLDKTFFKRPKFHNENGRLITLNTLGIQKPRQELIDEYEEEKFKFTRKLNKDALKELIESRKDKKKEHRCTFIYRIKEKVWRCKFCLKTVKTNPYKK